MDNNNQTKERFFSIELTSKNHLKNVTLTNGSYDNVLVEGTIGELVAATFAEDEILEVTGKKGVLRINLAQTDIQKNIEENQSEAKNIE
jgi:hypothetical protein